MKAEHASLYNGSRFDQCGGLGGYPISSGVSAIRIRSSEPSRYRRRNRSSVSSYASSARSTGWPARCGQQGHVGPDRERRHPHHDQKNRRRCARLPTRTASLTSRMNSAASALTRLLRAQSLAPSARSVRGSPPPDPTLGQCDSSSLRTSWPLSRAMWLVETRSALERQQPGNSRRRWPRHIGAGRRPGREPNRRHAGSRPSPAAE